MIRIACLSIALLACSHKPAPVAPTVAAPDAGSTTSAAATDAAPDTVVAPAPARTDLTALAQALPATIIAPPGSTTGSSLASDLTRDGFAYRTPIATITGGALGATAITISTGAKLGWQPTTLDADLADVARAGHTKVAAATAPNGNWAAAYQLTSSCYLHAWSPAAQLWCEASAPATTGFPCDQVQVVSDVCLSVEAKAAAITPVVDPSGAFANLHDDEALAAVVAAGHAVATDDRCALQALVDPVGFKLGKRTLDAARLAAAVTKAGSLSKLMGNDCATDDGRGCQWNSDSDGRGGKLRVYSRPGYGVIPTIELAPPAGWNLARHRVRPRRSRLALTATPPRSQPGPRATTIVSE